MSSLKRSVSRTDASISPPPLRRKLSGSARTISISSAVANNHITIFSWNVNGIYPLLQKQISFQSSKTFPLREVLKTHGWPHLLCLQEVKISQKDEVTKRKCQRAANEGNLAGEPTYTIHFSLPRDKYNATGFGGKVHGVATLIRDDVQPIVTQNRRPDWDLEGRVLIHETSCGLVIINGYWVNGTNNPYRDPRTGRVSGTRHDHKLRFHQRMLEDALGFEKQGKLVVLIGDMNVAPSRVDGHPNLRTSPDQHVKNRADFKKKFLTAETGLQGVDVFRFLHGHTRKYTYHPRGKQWGGSCDRVDLVVVSKKLTDVDGAVVASDICDTSSDRGHSDHVPLWITLDVSKLDAQHSWSVCGNDDSKAGSAKYVL